MNTLMRSLVEYCPMKDDRIALKLIVEAFFLCMHPYHSYPLLAYNRGILMSIDSREILHIVPLLSNNRHI